LCSSAAADNPKAKQSRLDFFKKELKMSRKKLELVQRRRTMDRVERMRMLSDAGEEVSYYEDVVKMLEEKAK
jgi:hypothetical protein